MANRIILSLFAPNFEGYDRLSQIDKSEWEVVEYEGLNAQEAIDLWSRAMKDDAPPTVTALQAVRDRAKVQPKGTVMRLKVKPTRAGS